jgi:hypothetical protein
MLALSLVSDTVVQVADDTTGDTLVEAVYSDVWCSWVVRSEVAAIPEYTNGGKTREFALMECGRIAGVVQMVRLGDIDASRGRQLIRGAVFR